jgi:hypothetical protein
MKSQLLVVAVCLLVVMPRVAIAQTRQAPSKCNGGAASFATHAFTNAGQHDEVIARLFAFSQPSRWGQSTCSRDTKTE